MEGCLAGSCIVHLRFPLFPKRLSRMAPLLDTVLSDLSGGLAVVVGAAVLVSRPLEGVASTLVDGTQERFKHLYRPAGLQGPL
jgi:hypothetical protein